MTMKAAGTTPLRMLALAPVVVCLLAQQAPRGIHAAAANKWMMGGPEGTLVSAIATDPLDPSVLYAATPIGVSKSRDSGRAWSHVLESPYVNVLAVDPQTPGTLYAGTGWISSNHDASGGIRKSIDGGRSWQVINDGLPAYDGSPRVRALAIDPAVSTTLYAGLWPGGVFKSTDGGQTWNSANNGLKSLNAISLAIDASDRATLYAGTGNGVFRSVDAGSSWSGASVGLPSDYYGPSSIGSIRIDPASPATLYAAGALFRWGDTDAPLYKSTDAGASWKHIGQGLNGKERYWRITDIILDPATNTLHASIGYDDNDRDWSGPPRPGVFSSRDGGERWDPVAAAPRASVNVLAADPRAPSTIYAGSSGDGVIRSSDGGATWDPINAGLPRRPVGCFIIDPRNASLHYAVTGGRLYRSLDRGSEWTEIGPFPGCPTIDPTAPATMYVPGGVSIRKTTDGGATWRSLGIGLDPDHCRNGCGITSFAMDPRAPRTLYAGAWSKPRIDRQSEGLFRSTDGGETWTRFWDGSQDFGSTVSSLLIDPQTSTVYAGSNRGVWGAGCGQNGFDWYIVLSLAINRANPSTLYATMPDGLFRCTGTVGWSPLNNGLPYRETSHGRAYCLGAPSIDPRTPARMYLGECLHGLFMSANGGESWSPFDPPLPHGLSANVTIDPVDPTILYVPTRAGIFRIKQRPK